MAEITVKQKCWYCNGSGIFGSTVETSSCAYCLGVGWLDSHLIVDITEITAKLDAIIAEQASQRADLTAAFADVNDKLADILDKCNDIFEKVNE